MERTQKKRRIGTEAPPSNANHCFLLVLGSATTVNGTTISVYIATAAPKAKEAQNAFAQRRGGAIVVTPWRSGRGRLVAICTVIGVGAVSGGSAMGTTMVTVRVVPVVGTVVRVATTGATVTATPSVY